MSNYEDQKIEDSLALVLEQGYSFRETAELVESPKVLPLYDEYMGKHGDKLGRPSFRETAELVESPKVLPLYDEYMGKHGDKLGRPPALSAVEDEQITTALGVAADFK
ncbi:hypothetical protein QE152_g36668 [Popillia japonica]|uniref:Uncharacterized protein n=1 Tax=Popillia japonica TaxID=7064 RepID=A0AAW1ICK6_POPJA